MSDADHNPDSTHLDTGIVWAAFEAAWYEEPPRRLTLEELCDEFRQHSRERLHAEYRQHWLELFWSDLRVELEKLAREGRPPNWPELVGEAPELSPRAKAHFAACGGREGIDFLAEAAASLNLRDYPGSRSSYEKERLKREREQVRPEDRIEQIERDFELIGVAGSGGFGIVFEAYDAVLDRHVAVKKVLPSIKDRPGAKERLEREAMILAKLEHPNILPLYNILKPHPQAGKEAEPAFVMRLLPESLVRGNTSPITNGGPPRVTVRRLKDAIKYFHENTGWDSRTRRNQFRRLLQQFVDVCQGIAYAHQRKVVHRDIKPGNVVLGPHGETVVIDWGIARVLVDDERHTGDLSSPAPEVEGKGAQFSLDGSGTKPYASPEQWPRTPDDSGPIHPQLSFEAVRQPADVYALGATLWELLNGRAPPDLVPHEHRFDHFPEGTPFTLQQIVRKATSFNPWDRYVSQRELEWFLQRIPDLKACPAFLADANSRNDEPDLGGVEQLRQAVQDWLDEEAANQIADPLKQEIEAVSKERDRVHNQLVASKREVYLLEKTANYLKRINKSLVAAAVVISIVAGTAYWQSSSMKSRVEQEAEAAVLRRDLQSILEVLDNGKLVEARERFSVVQDRPNTFAWNYVWQAVSREPTRTLVGNPDGIASHRGQVLAIGVNQQGEYLTFGADGQLLTWDPKSEHPTRKSMVELTVGTIGLDVESQDGRILVTELSPGFPAAASGMIQPHDQILAVGSAVDKMVPVSGKTYDEIHRLLSGDVAEMIWIRLTRTGIAAPFDVELIRKAASVVLTSKWYGNSVFQRFSPDGRWLAVSALLDKESAVVALVETATGEVRQTWPVKETPDLGFVHSLSFSGNSERLVLAGTLPKSLDKSDPFELKGVVVDLTHPDIPVVDQEIINSGFAPVGWTISRDGRRVIGFGLGLGIDPRGLWRVNESDKAKRTQALSQPGDKSPTGFLNLVSPDDRFLAVSSLDSQVHIQSSDGSKHIVTLGKKSQRRGVAFGRKSTLLAVADGTQIDIYRVSDWQRVTSFPFDMTFQNPSIQPVMAFAADDQSLLVGSEQGVQLIPLKGAFDHPAQTDFGPLARFTASRWSGSGDETSLWIAESHPFGGHRSGVRLQQLTIDGSVKQTLGGAQLGDIQSIPVMSQDGKRVFVSRTSAAWAKNSRLETWDLGGRAHVAWSRTFDSSVARVIRDFPDGSLFVETYTDRMQFIGDELLERTSYYLDQTGRPINHVPTATDSPWRITPAGELLSIRPFPLETFSRGHAQDAAVLLTSQDRKSRRALEVQALNAVVSDDNRYLAAVVVQGDQPTTDYGTLKVFSMSDFQEVASLDDHRIPLSFDFGLNFSPNGSQVAVASLGGQVLVWDHKDKTVIFNKVWKPDGWQQAWATGAVFTPSGRSLVVAGYDRQVLTDPHRQSLDPRHVGGLLAMIDLTSEVPTFRVVRNDVGLVALGEASKDRSRICSVNVIDGKTKVWEMGDGDPQLVETIESDAGAYDHRWAEFVSVDAIALTTDQKRLAAAGTAVIDGNKKVARIVVFNVEAKSVISSVDIGPTDICDVAWLGDGLRLLTCDDNDRVQLLAWKPGAESTALITTHETTAVKARKEFGHMTHPQFSTDGTQYAVPMLLVDARETAVAHVPFVFESDGGDEVARPTKYEKSHDLQGYQWGYDGRLAIATIARNTKDLTRHISIWNPASGEFKPLTTDRMPSTDGSFSNARQAHLMISPDGDSVIVAKVGRPDIEVWSESGEHLMCRITLNGPQHLRALQISPNGDALFLAQFHAGATLLRAPRLAGKSQIAESKP